MGVDRGQVAQRRIRSTVIVFVAALQGQQPSLSQAAKQLCFGNSPRNLPLQLTTSAFSRAAAINVVGGLNVCLGESVLHAVRDELAAVVGMPGSLSVG